LNLPLVIFFDSSAGFCCFLGCVAASASFFISSFEGYLATILAGDFELARVFLATTTGAAFGGIKLTLL
jgi:hypothetical protein